MKKTLIIILLLLPTLFANAQAWQYHPMPESNAIWSVHSIYYHIGPPNTDFYYQYYINGDTTIGSYNYKKVYASGNSFYNSIFIEYFNQFCFAFRQDTVQKKVFIPLNNSDTLLFDFNLSVGDTMHLFAFHSSDPRFPAFDYNINKIISIDSVLIGSHYHKRFNFENCPSGSTFCRSIIEGVGSNTGLWNSGYGAIIDNFFSLTCYSHNSDTYPNTVTNCTIIDSVTRVESITQPASGFSISPNPFTSSSSITFAQTQTNSNLKLLDVFGQVIKTITFTGKQLTLYNDNLKPGIYFLQLTNNNNYIINRKIVVQ